MSATPLTLVIVGGVAGGASAAARARRMNEHARIILFERDEHVSFANCGLPYYIGGEIAERKKLLVAPEAMLRRRFRLEIHARHEVISVDRASRRVEVLDHEGGARFFQGYDRLILAPGASPLVPAIPGVGARGVFTLRNLEDTDRVKAAAESAGCRRVVVVGAGYIGLEMAEQFARRGLEVSLVELQPRILPGFDPEMTRPIEEALRGRGLETRLGDGIEEVLLAADGSARGIRLASGATVEGELVVLGLGVRPNVKLARDAGLAMGPGGGIVTNEYLQTSDPAIYAVGDAAEYAVGPAGVPARVALAGPANRAGRIAGEHAVTGRSRPMARVLGSSIVRVFDQVASMTGLSGGQAERLGIAARSVTIIANQHAGYFPGSRPMTLKLLFEPDTGRILGAQAVGSEGVDKRIDVIATAMAFGGTVADLAGLDLAYAPPFGSAKDPVHMAAFAACNQLDGLEDFLDAGADLGEVTQFVDVRTAAEVAELPFPGAPESSHVIPVDELRDRVGELDPAARTVVSCRTGVRAHVAARILRQLGFARVQNSSGGVLQRIQAYRPSGRSGGE